MPKMPARAFRRWLASGDLVNSRDRRRQGYVGQERAQRTRKKDGENLTQSRKDAKVKTKAGIATKERKACKILTRRHYGTKARWK
jgi:hypothetical protein